MTGKSVTHSEQDDYDVTEAMIVYGGGFVSGLGHLFRQADPVNQRKLKAAFPEYWNTYREIAATAAQKRDAS